jgi:aryl-phospho-beta-D-glucosidase BglC (GH1 family)
MKTRDNHPFFWNDDADRLETLRREQKIMQRFISAVLALTLVSCTTPTTEATNPTLAPTIETRSPAPTTALPIIQTSSVHPPFITGWLRTTGTQILDSQNRRILFQGVNSSGMEWGEGDPWQNGSCDSRYGCWAMPSSQMYDNLTAWGINVVRLPISWADLEPNAPVNGVHQYNQAYLTSLDQIVQKLGERHIAVILSMHQWAWSAIFLAARPNDGKIIHGLGMPAWLYPNATGAYNGSTDPARIQGQIDFFQNTNNVQDGFIAAWQIIARRYADDPTVVGADMFNEPGIFPTQTVKEIPLDDFYRRVGAAIRAENPNILLIFEEGWHTPVSAPPPFANELYSFHYYPPEWGNAQEDYVNKQLAQANSWNMPIWLGEFQYVGPMNQPAGANGWEAQTQAMLEFLKEHNVGWTYWAYQRAARPIDDPTLNIELIQVLQMGF